MCKGLRRYSTAHPTRTEFDRNLGAIAFLCLVSFIVFAIISAFVMCLPAYRAPILISSGFPWHCSSAGCRLGLAHKARCSN